MSNFKGRIVFGGISEKAASQIISILTFIIIGLIFLLASTYFILGCNDGKQTASLNIKKPELQESSIVIKENKDLVSDIKVDKIKIYLTKEDRVVEIPLEEYIKGVISSEMPVNFELEALKAQAIAARTYTIAHTTAMGGGCKNGKGADLCDSTHCQVYMSKENKVKLWGQNGSKNWNKIEEAVNSTEGQVMAYNGELAKGAYYFSTSGGRTENSEDVFVNALPYLRSVDSKGEEEAPRYKSNVKIPYSKIVERANMEYSADMVTSNMKSQIQILSRSEGGSVKEIKLGKAVISGPKFRSLYGLNSANFELNFLNEELEVNCIGFGHGVGMSQWGANTMAKNGSKCDEIIKHYYTGIDIKKINNK